MGLQPERVVDCACQTGEGPLWHPDESCLYWTDIPAARLYRFSPQDGRVETFDTDEPVGGMTLEADGALMCFMARGAVKAWRGGAFGMTVVDAIEDERANRFNDVMADPAGRVFCGTLSTPERSGRLYRIDPSGTLHRVLDGVGTSNGMGFTPDGTGLYHTDTRRHTITLFDYDAATGAIENRRVWVRVDEGASRPDGLTVDAQGCVWSARWEGAALVRYDPDGVEMQRVVFPARHVTCPAFGGRDYDTLYVTTAGGHDRAALGSGAGALFRVPVEVRGTPEFRSRLAAVKSA